MLFKCCRPFAVIAMLMMIHSSAFGQSVRLLERLQLTRAWGNTAQVDPSRGGVAAVVLAVNNDPKQATTIFAVEYEGGKRQFSENDLAANGLLGIEEAKRLAEKEVIIRNAMKQNPKLTTLKVPPVSLIVTSTSGMVQNFDAETGREIWSVSVGNPDYPTTAASASNEYVSVVNGATLYALSRKTGEVKLERRLQANPIVGIGKSIAGPITTEDWVFVPCMQGQMKAFTLEKVKDPTLKYERKPWIYRAGDRIVGRAVVADSFVAWASRSGRFIVGKVEDPEVLFRYDTNARMAGQPSFANGRFYFASTNGFVFALDPQQEILSWEVSTGEPLDSAPTAIDKDLFLTSIDDNMICLASKDGTRTWTTPGIQQFLAASKTRVYVRSPLGKLKVLDRKTGRVLADTNIEFDLAVRNQVTDRLYLATRSGNLYCYKETGTEFATVHNPVKSVEDAKAADKKKPVKEKTPADAGDDSEFGIDNFGTDQTPADDADDGTFDFGDDSDASADTDDAADTTDEAAEDDTADDEGDIFDFGGDE